VAMLLQHQEGFGHGGTDSVLHPIVAVAMAVAVVGILFLPRKYVIGPLLLVTFTVPFGQQVVVGGLHLFIFRILVLFGWIRLLRSKVSTEGSIFATGINPVDRAFFWGIVCQTAAVMVQYLQMSAVINQFGLIVDYLGGYFLLRFLLRDEEDIYRAIKFLVLVVVIVSVGMAIEQLKFRNIFGELGGVPITPELREGRIRSQGPFEHSLLAGTFGATLVPLFCLLWKNGKAKLIALVGLAGATIMTVTSSSSTSLLAYAGAVLGVCLWPIRKKMRTVRWGIIFGLVALQLAMKVPFWWAIGHVSLVGGSSSWHRAAIVDQFIMHFTSWWLIGTKDVGSWGFSMWDAQNEFVSVGETGGLAAFVLFIMVISRSFGRLGAARKAIEGDTKQEWTMWLLGAALFSHIVGFFGVNYFDQTKFGWFLLLVMISTATAPILQGSTVPKVALQEEPIRRSWAQPVTTRASKAKTVLPVHDPLVKRAQ
jgi:hypothetical protein